MEKEFISARTILVDGGAFLFSQMPLLYLSLSLMRSLEDELKYFVRIACYPQTERSHCIFSETYFIFSFFLGWYNNRTEKKYVEQLKRRRKKLGAE